MSVKKGDKKNQTSAFWLILGTLVVLIGYGYWNHFDNGFEFDDYHTIVDNEYIQDIRNIPEFFTNIETFGTNPLNRGYRPIVTTLNAIDFWLAGELNPRYFHYSFFFYYLVQLGVLFFFLRNLLSKFLTQPRLNVISLLLTGFYGLHTSNAETINYIISRSDQFSTLCILVGLLLYQWQLGKKYYLFVLPVIVGMATKEVVAVFPILLFAYILLIEEKEWNFRSMVQAVIRVLPVFILVILLFYWFSSMNPAGSSLASNTLGQRIQYLCTQAIVITHYIGNFILPLELNVDPDFTLVTSYSNHKVIFSVLLNVGLILVGFYSARKPLWKPIAFGIFWFYICLGPTSSIIPFGQIANDHRTFLPYIGLVLSSGWAVYLFFSTSAFFNHVYVRYFWFFVLLMIFLGHSLGVRSRSDLWNSSKLLWYDSVQKGPGNARSQLNYGLALMAEGDYSNAMVHFKEAESISPNWSVIQINLGVLHEGLYDYETAEEYFLKAIALSPYYPECYYYYARFLQSRGRVDEAIVQLETGQSYSPAYFKTNELLDQLRKEVTLNQNTNQAFISDVNLLINVSLSQYKKGDFQGCIETCQKVLEFDPQNAVAYNNICSAYNSLQQWDNAIEACERALEIDTSFVLARENLKFSQRNR
jgi:tetratricopeptide (TPR) repeat protein